MKAIQIKYCGPTNTKGARWKVWAESTSAKYFNRSYELDGRDDANFCVSAYLKEMGWNNDFTMGTLPNGDYVAVLK
jgi:hypothetical protein